jgi:hypothetical protein
MDSAPAVVRALVDNPAVEDTHHIDRVTGVVSGDAPSGTAPLASAGIARLIRSPLFDWVVSFCLASLAVSGVWLVSARDSPRH